MKKFKPLLFVAMVTIASGCSTDLGDSVATLTGADAKPKSSPMAKDPDKAFLDFARCMRKHGIDMPDPQTDDEGRVMFAPAPEARPAEGKFAKADEACRHHLAEATGFHERDAQLDPKMEEAMLKFAHCMRENGIDMPDPQEGGLIFRKEEGPGETDAQFQRAEKACRHLLGDPKTLKREQP